MNIFVLDRDPVRAAQYHCDKHSSKMVVESAQMLSTAHRILDGVPERRLSKSGKTHQLYYKLPDTREDLLYLAVHKGHPCTVWSMENAANYNWHYRLFSALCDEYTHRYGKTHKTDTLLRDALKTPPKNIKTSSRDVMSPHPLAMGAAPHCKGPDPVESYRSFYKTKQARFNMVWTKRETPAWFKK